MSSSPLYLAIVVVWLIVLVPMLLRKDSVDAVPEEPRREDEDTGAEAEAEAPEGGDEDYEEEAAPAAEPAPLPAPRANERRSRVIARRRRRTTVLTLLTAGTAIAVAFGLGPWWVTIPPVLLLGGHLVLLREAAKADAEQRAAVLRARRRAALRARRLAERQEREAEREAEIIALRDRRSQVYDQYADARLRAAGD
ncbi:divisome protein SepX/GlpR [Nocardiopsis changdeensis]|uniref:divisome protein SepX/GlpR n=1 Tax=Nocardiopsis changdeensis TaxID=2831969 RepID=UPI003F463686